MEERETFPKRPREEVDNDETTGDAKRIHRHLQQGQQQRPAYHHILSSLLEEEGAAGAEDEEGEISSLMSALQQELSPSVDDLSLPTPAALNSGAQAEAEEGCDAEGLMRRLLEASDDDLGIPPSVEVEGVTLATVEGSVGEEEEEEEEEGTTVCGDAKDEEDKGRLGGGLLGGGPWVDNLDMDAMVPGFFSYDYYALLQPGLF